MTSKHDSDDRHSELSSVPEAPAHRLYTVEDYFNDMNAVMSGKFVFSSWGGTKPVFDVSGLIFLLKFPLFFVITFLKDPFSGWVKWRIVGALLSVVITTVVFLISVGVGVIFDLSDDSFVIDSMLNIVAAGFLGTVIFVWPRTMLLLIITMFVLWLLSLVFSLILI